MKTLIEIRERLNIHIQMLCEKYPIKTMAIFGSYSRKEQTETSDLDILVDFNSQIGARFIDLADEIELITGERVDLVSRKGIKEKYFQAIQPDLIYV